MEELIEIIKECKQADQALELLYKYIKPTPNIEKAVAFTIEKHKGQYRKSGEEYVIHPL